MADYGIKVSQAGYDVGTASIENLVISSGLNQWKISAKGSVTFTSDGQEILISHGLGYTPAYLVLKKKSGDSYYGWANVNNYVNDTNLRLFGNTNDMASYIIFIDFGA